MNYQIKKTIKCGKGKSVFTVTAGFDLDFARRANQQPHFAVTAEETNVRGRVVCCGMRHSEVRRRFPELAPLLKWHLVGTDRPMHYEANARYHLEGFYGLRALYTGETREQCLEHFKSTVVWNEATDGGKLPTYETSWSRSQIETDRTRASIRAALTEKALAEDGGVDEDEINRLLVEAINRWDLANLRKATEKFCADRKVAMYERMKADLVAAGIDWPEG